MVSIKHLTFAFKKNQPLFRNLNLMLEKGHMYGLFGLNGAGKTTLLNHISGLLFPKSGSIQIEGEESRERHPDTMRRLYLLPEQFDLPNIDADSYIRLHAPFYPSFDHKMAAELMNQLKVTNEKPLPQLSYGQRKKFLIAFALSTHADVVLMDEPTNGLDIPSKSQFRKVMAATDHTNRCVLISTHQVRDLDALIDHVIVLNDGKIIFQQDIETISKTLRFEKIEDGDERSPLYGEDVFGGESVILPHTDKTKETPVDLELLFNGIIEKSELINQQFQTLSS
ncbi:MAG: ATP-binding cassette domain-containing protein [Bacteroidetes bacterium]|jgi:ABC-2 type transport system ATP-binding protein|nr:ATP-binding cassette domain-containing protein [Bacteroidota bacterium]